MPRKRTMVSQAPLPRVVLEFHEFLKAESLLDVQVEREHLRVGAFSRFRETRKLQSLKTPCLGDLLFFMKMSGFLKARKGGKILVGSSKKKTEKVFDALAAERLKREKSNTSAVGVVTPKDALLSVSPLLPAVMIKNRKESLYVRAIEENHNSDSSMMVLSIKNQSSATVLIRHCIVLSNRNDFSASSSDKETLCKDQECVFTIFCKNIPKKVGIKSTKIQFCLVVEGFKSDVMSPVYHIQFEKVDDIVKALKPKNGTKKSVGVAKIPTGELVPGQKPSPLHGNNLERIVRVRQYKVEQCVKDAVKSGAFMMSEQDKGYHAIRNLLEQEVSLENYARKFHILLQLEELQCDFDILRYSMSCVKMVREGKIMFLNVPGLAEKRPSVLRGDTIIVTIEGENPDSQKQYEGYVHFVELHRIGLGFSSSLLNRHRKTNRYNVRFIYNRYPLRLAHRAIDLPLAEEVYFPKQCGILHLDITITAKQLKNESIRSNPQQMQAISNIVRGKVLPVPYIVFGPPGTGKTMTLVEAICQVIEVYEGCHVLVCAPSNSACDHLAKLLMRYARPDNIFRMHALSRPWKDVPEEIHGISNYTNGEYYFPMKDDLEKFEILICTLATAGRIASAGFPDDYFTHVFIDEAGQATEPQCRTALAGILSSDGQLVLAGDPKQLGPIVTSAVAKRYGLGKSYLERIMETQSIYERDTESQNYNSLYITKLLKNYRSHRAILKVPNECFYDDELSCEIKSTDETKQICDWEYLPCRGFPVIFEGVAGRDLREDKSPSFFNAHEVSIVTQCVMELTEFKFSGKDIGIITPYRKQVEKIRQNIKGVDGVKIGTVEEFQGQEKKVIIISTVRSDTKYLDFDVKHNLGFLSDPKRFNVAITRAKFLLIVIGNPNILSLDYYWKRFFEYCITNGGYRGVEYKEPSERKAEMDEVLTQLSQLDISS